MSSSQDSSQDEDELDRVTIPPEEWEKRKGTLKWLAEAGGRLEIEIENSENVEIVVPRDKEYLDEENHQSKSNLKRALEIIQDHGAWLVALAAIFL